MVFLKRLAFLILFSFIAVKGIAQTFTSGQKKTYKIVKDTLILDSLSIVPGSVLFKNFPAIDSADFPKINYKLHALIFRKKKPDSILVSYKRFPFNFENKFFHKDQDQL